MSYNDWRSEDGIEAYKKMGGAWHTDDSVTGHTFVDGGGVRIRDHVSPEHQPYRLRWADATNIHYFDRKDHPAALSPNKNGWERGVGVLEFTTGFALAVLRNAGIEWLFEHGGDSCIADNMEKFDLAMIHAILDVELTPTPE